ncbi:MAG: GNAT family N-acetyltransferase [Alphaproteobacteria bacterium]
MTATIRPYQDADLQAVIHAWESASRVAHSFVTEQFLDEERHNIPTLYLPNADTYVAEVGSNVVGFIALIGEEVGAIFLDPAYHGQGIGRAMMDKAASLNEIIKLRVFADNTVGRAFYASYGFTEEGAFIDERTGLNMLWLHYTRP